MAVVVMSWAVFVYLKTKLCSGQAGRQMGSELRRQDLVVMASEDTGMMAGGGRVQGKMLT